MEGADLKLSLDHSISARSRKLALWAAVVFLCYTLFGFLLLPPIVRVIAAKQLSKQLDRPVTILKVRINPYTFSATARGLLIKDKDGAPLASWDEIHVNFQLASLFSHAWRFKEVSLSQPFLRVQVNKDYRLNFSDIVDKFSPVAASKPGETGRPRAWRINRLRLTGGKVSFTDLTPRMPFQRTVGPLEITVTNFQTASDHNPAALAKLDVLANGLYERPELQLEIQGSADPVTDLKALRRAELNQRLVAQEWNAPLFATGTNAATAGQTSQRSPKAFAFEKGASALRSPGAHSSKLPIQSTVTEEDPGRSSLRAFADEKGATALMLIFAPRGAADPDWERELLEAVELSPEALPALAVERARNVKAYLLQTGKIEAQRITESARGAGFKSSRVYLRLQ